VKSLQIQKAPEQSDLKKERLKDEAIEMYETFISFVKYRFFYADGGGAQDVGYRVEEQSGEPLWWPSVCHGKPFCAEIFDHAQIIRRGETRYTD